MMKGREQAVGPTAGSESVYTKCSSALNTGARTSSSLTTPSAPSRMGVLSSALNTGLRAVRMILCARSVSPSTCARFAHWAGLPVGCTSSLTAKIFAPCPAHEESALATAWRHGCVQAGRQSCIKTEASARRKERTTKVTSARSPPSSSALRSLPRLEAGTCAWPSLVTAVLQAPRMGASGHGSSSGLPSC